MTDKRLVAAIGMMGASTNAGDAEAVSAFRVAGRLLAERGLTWRDVAERAFGEQAQAQVAGDAGRRNPGATASDMGAAFADVFDLGAFKRAAKPEAPRAATKPRFSGTDVPGSIFGTPRIVDGDRSSRNGPMLVIEIEGEHAVWGPLVCFREDLQARLRAAAGTGSGVRATTRAPANARHLPQVTALPAI